MHLRLLVPAVLVALLSGGLTSGAVEAQRPPSLTRDALLNAPVKGACQGTWSGRLDDGQAWDPGSVLIRAVELAVGDLDARPGRDGALVLRCTTDFLYPDAVALYTAGRNGRAAFRGLVDLSRLAGDDGYHVDQAYALAVRGRAVTVRWTYDDTSWSDGAVVTRPMTAELALERGRVRVKKVRAAGAPEVAATFAAAMLHRRWKAARVVATADAVAEMKDAPRSSWRARPSCAVNYVDETNTVECSVHDASVLLGYDEGRHRWLVTGGYVWN